MTSKRFASYQWDAKACKRAGVEPRFETLNGKDPVTFIMSANERRRHMNKGQRAMEAAKIGVILNSTDGEGLFNN